ncbi:MAG: Na+/H+ antiporter NhaC family protein, partial [Xanthomonadales bacterium]|nr:Na+/H+ antiporter NhaC family protein [Xanthomonadales bacterium]
WAVLGGNIEAHPEVFYSAIACVLAGAVWGDHCSPISDTTVLSSMASGCDHIAHVRTQLPYAMLVGLIALIVGTLPTGFGAPVWVCMLLGIGLLFAVLQVAGQRPEDPID